MVDFEGVRLRLWIALGAIAWVACGRTGFSLLEGNEPTAAGGTPIDPTIGAAMPTEARAGSGGLARSAGAGGAVSNASGGFVGRPLGGTGGMVLGGSGGEELAGAGGTGGTGPELPYCDAATTPRFDGPPALGSKARASTSIAGDWNRDGKLDLATGDDDGQVSVWFGSGDGSFAYGVRYENGSPSTTSIPIPTFITAGDLDENGSLDLIVTHSEPAAVSVLLGAPDGSFGSAVSYPIQDGPSELLVGDFDGDGRADVAVAGESGTVSVLLGNGDGTFGAARTTRTRAPVRSLSADDLNHDGRLDLVTLDNSELSIWLGDGAGGFVKTQQFETGQYHGAARIGDFNADSQADVVVSAGCGSPRSTGSVLLFLGHGDGTFSDLVRSRSATNCVRSLVVADLNRDGAADVLTAGDTTFLGNREAGTMRELVSSKVSGGTPLGVGDWNGDGDLDLVASDDHWLAVYLGSGDGSFGTSAVYPTAGRDSWSLALADLNGDERLDVAINDWVSSSSVIGVLTGTGNGRFLPQVDHPTARSTALPAAADLDGDGWLDLVAVSDSAKLSVLLGTGHGNFAPEVLLDSSNSVGAFAIADLNGDRRLDIVTTNAPMKSVSLLFGKGDGTFVAGASRQLPGAPADVAVLDANGDAKLDLVITLDELATMDVLLGNGDGTFAADHQYSTVARARNLTSVDLDADGKADVIVWGSDFLSVFLGAGDGTFARRTDYSGYARNLVAVDIDRDGHLDLAMTGYTGVDMLLGAGDGTFTCRAGYAPGTGTSSLAAGDLNHDGRIDLVVSAYPGVGVFLNRTP